MNTGKRIMASCLLAACMFGWFSMPHRSVLASVSEYGNVYYRSSSHSQQIALTFDDGPHPRYTEEILEILNEYQISATFFIIGVNAEAYPEELKKIVDSGCEIGNHTYSHKRIQTLSVQEMKEQFLQCEETIVRLTGIRPQILRPPEGKMTDSLRKVACELNCNVVLWNIDTLDWALNPSETIVQTVMKNVKGGDIILMHDYVSGGNTTCGALRRMIPALLSQGYEFVTVSQLIDGDHAVSRVPVFYAVILFILPFRMMFRLTLGTVQSYTDRLWDMPHKWS